MNKNKNNPILHQEFFYQAPIPPANEMEKYEKILSGAADRILTMAEKQASHRQSLEKEVIDGNTSIQSWGLILGFIVIMTSIIGGLFLVYLDKEVYGMTSIIAALTSLVGVFIYGRSRQEKERKDNLE